jgi:hypothetical protein
MPSKRIEIFKKVSNSLKIFLKCHAFSKKNPCGNCRIATIDSPPLNRDQKSTVRESTVKNPKYNKKSCKIFSEFSKLVFFCSKNYLLCKLESKKLYCVWVIPIKSIQNYNLDCLTFEDFIGFYDYKCKFLKKKMYSSRDFFLKRKTHRLFLFFHFFLQRAT